MQAQTTPQPYQGGISGFLGNVNQGVTQATQDRAQFEQEADQLRQLQLMGRQNEYNIGLAKMENTWGKARLEDEQLFSTEQTAQALDVTGSATARDGIIQSLTAIGDVTNPKNKQAVNRIMKRARGMGLEPYDLETVEATAIGLGSGTAALGWQDRLQESMQGKLTTEQLEQNIKLGEQTFTLNGQEVQLGEYMLDEQEYIAGRRHIEDALTDRAAMDEVIARAVANGDDKAINDLLNTLEAGGTVNSGVYEALTSAGITAESLQQQYGGALDSSEWRTKRHSLDMTEMRLAEGQLYNAARLSDVELASAQNAYADQLAKSMTPAEIDEALKNPRSSLSMFKSAGIFAPSDIKSMKRNASVYGILRQDEVLAPKLERAVSSLEMLAAVPQDPAVAENALRSTLSTFVDAGVYSEETAEGIVSAYREAWEYGQQTQDNELAAAEAARAYQVALTSAQMDSLTATAADTGWSEETKELLDATQTAFDSTREDIETQYPQCFTSDGGVFSGGECARAYQLVEDNRLQREGAVREVLGALAPQDTLSAMTDVLNTADTNVRSSPEFQGATETAVVTEISRRLVAQGFPPLPQKAFEEAAALDGQNAPASQPAQTGPRTLAGDVSNAATGAVGAVAGAMGSVNRFGNRVEEYVTGRPRQAAPAPATINPTITRDMSYRKLLQGGLTPEQEMTEFESLTRRYGVNASDLARYLQEQRGR